MLTSALPFVAIALPGAAYAQATNTATVTAPPGAIELDPGNNSATDTDTLLATIVANDDTASGAFGTLGANDVLSVLDNDLFNGAGATVSDVTISVAPGFTVPGELTFDTATGLIDVAAGTAAGTYSFDYRICETANPTNCVDATATVTVTAPTISADADSVAGINGLVGATDVLDVLDGDFLGGDPATTANVTLSVITPATPINGSPVPTLDTATGLVSVAPGTAAGVYEITYQICDVVNPTVCATETATITVDAAPIVADDDSVAGVDGAAGAADVLDVLDGDTLGGVQVALGDVDITVLAPATPINGGPVPTLDTATGLVSVAAGTPAGTYTIEYRICETLNTANCDDAFATVTVAPPVVVADDDSASGINGADGAADVVNVLDGDTVNGAPVTIGDVTLSVVTPATPINGGPVPTLDTATGFVSVPAGTPAGIYTITYEVCDALNPTVCDEGEVTITVDAPAIVADDESVAGINGADGAADVLDVLDGDTLNGAPVTIGDVTLTVVTPATPINGGPVPTLNVATGLVSVPAGTPAGVYTIEYQICDPVNTSNCDIGLAEITVAAPAITADADSVTGLDGVAGAADVLDVLDGDTLNGAPATIGNVTVSVVTPATPINGGPVPTLDTASGLVQLPAGTPGGTYEITYQICDALNPTNCATEVATVVVASSVNLSITKDNGVTEVRSGDTVTYTLVVSNAGPDAATGAVVSDAPGAGLTCPAGNLVAITGDGVPPGSFTVADLTGAGITLGTLSAGQSATITYSCSVN